MTFFFCLRGYNYSPSHRDDWNCPLGTRSSIGFPISTSSITFSVGPNIAGSLTNPVVFTGDSWPVSSKLCTIIYIAATTDNALYHEYE